MTPRAFKLAMPAVFRLTALKRREPLTLLATDGRLEASNDVAEHAMRGIALGT
jgi:hypothetical protein